MPMAVRRTIVLLGALCSAPLAFAQDAHYDAQGNIR